MALGSLVDEIVVQGVRQGISSSLSKALSGALAGSASKFLSGGALGGLSSGPRSGALEDAVGRIQSNLQNQSGFTNQPAPPSSAGPQGFEVEGLTVTAPRIPTPSAGGALGAVLGGSGSNFLAGGSGADTIVPPAAAAPETEVEGITVTAPAAQPSTVSPAGSVLGSAMGMQGIELDPVEVRPIDQPERIGPEDLLLPAAAAGALLTMGGGGSITPAGGGGFSPSDLLPLAPLLPLIPGVGGGGDSSAQEGLEEIAKNNSALANRLGNIVSAGFAGDIGGRGLNSIARMVRKAQAGIRQRYSGMGMSGSSAEMADLNAAAQAGVDLQFKVGQEMAQHGLTAIASLTGQSANIYAQLLNAQTSRNTALGNALANFAGALVD